MEELSKFVFGAIGGGFAATVFRVLDATLQSRREKKQSAQATLRKYAKPLWLAAHALESRLDHVANTLKNRSALKSIPRGDICSTGTQRMATMQSQPHTTSRP